MVQSVLAFKRKYVKENTSGKLGTSIKVKKKKKSSFFFPPLFFPSIVINIRRDTRISLEQFLLLYSIM